MGRYIGIVLMATGIVAFIGSVFFLFLLSVMSAALSQLPAEDMAAAGLDMQVQEFGVMLGVLWIFTICWLVSSIAAFWFGWSKFRTKKK